MNATQYNYATVTHALADLKARGYNDEFDFRNSRPVCNEKCIDADRDALKITGVYRFEGISDPEDSSVVYAIESTTGLKGILIDSYGVYADSAKTEFIKGLKMEA